MSLTVGQLKKLIADLPDNMDVVTPGSDHSYLNASGWVTDTAYDEGYGGHFEYAGDEHMNEHEVKSRALVIGLW